jgi:hypothetical protein
LKDDIVTATYRPKARKESEVANETKKKQLKNR